MISINIRKLLIGVVFFLLTLGNAASLTSFSLNQPILYLGFFLLSIIIVYNFFSFKTNDKIVTLIVFIIVNILFNLGILKQSLSLNTKVRLIFTMVIISIVALFTERTLLNKEEVRIVGIAILVAIVVSTVLSLAFKVSLTTLAVEGVGDSSFGFNGGLQHKNYYAVAILASFICLNISNKNKVNSKILFVDFILLLLSNSRGGYILFAVYLIVSNFNKIKYFNQDQRYAIYLILSLIIAIFFGILYSKFVLNSQSYDIRLQGLTNYFQIYGNDTFHLWFGNAEMAFRDSGLTYEENVRSILGWNGTTELSILSVLIKNGLLGLIGYILIFGFRVSQLIKLRSSEFKLQMFAVLTVLLVSSLLENYIVNIQIVFGMVCYTLIGSLLYMGRNFER